MAFKFVLLACSVAALTDASYIHGPMNHHFGPSTAHQNLRYPVNPGGNSQGQNPQQENIVRGQTHLPNSSQQKTVQINAGTYSHHLSNQGKSDVRVTNPGTYPTGSYNVAPSDGHHEQQVTFASTPGYNNQNQNQNGGYDHSISSSSSSYQQSTPVYGHSSNPGTVFGHHTVPVYQYVNSGYGLPAVTGFAHNGNAYQQHGVSQSSSSSSSSSAPSGGARIIGVPYSPAEAVSHMSFSSPVGISYAW